MSFIRRSVHIASKQIAYLVIMLLVLLITSLGVVYWLSGAVEQRQDEIAAWASEQIGYPVEIGAAGIHWLGLLPKVQLESVKILDKSKKSNILSLDDLYVGLDIVASMAQGEPVLNDVTLTGLALSVERNEAGKIQVKGLNHSSSSNNQDWLAWIKILNRFHLQSIMINYDDQLATALSGSYHITNAIVTHQSDQWTSTGNIRLPDTLGQQLQFQAQAKIGSTQDNAWQWQLKTNNLNLGRLAQRYTWQDIAVEEGLADINLSGSGQGTTINAVMAEVQLSKSKIMSRNDEAIAEPVIIDHLTGTFDWQNKRNSWQLSGRNIQLYMNEDEWPETGFTINKNDDGTWLIAGNYIRLSDITSLASLSKQSPEILRQQRPAGDIERFNLRYSVENGVSALAFKVSDGAVDSWNDYPGFTGLTMLASWNEGLAKLEFQSHDFTLYAKKWLDDAVFFDSISGNIELQKSEKTWLVKSDKFEVWNDDLTLQLDGQVEQLADGEIVNNIKLELKDIVVEHWQQYVPQNILSASFKQWSSKAFKAGKIVDGDIEWIGKLSAFPYNNGLDDGLFKMALNVDNIQLHYAEEWPDLFGVTGTIEGHGHDLTIKSQQGKVAGFDFADVTTVINKLNEKKPILTVEGKLKGSSKLAASFLQNSPLNERFGSALKPITMTGKSDIDLELIVPLANTNETNVAGHVSFIKSQLHHKEIEVVGLQDINGLLRFDNDGVYAKNIEANLFDEAVEITVKPKGSKTGISMVGQISTDKLTSLWPNDIPHFIQGKTDYKLDITILEKEVGDFYLDYSLHSDLKGVDIDIPKPFIKAKGDKKELNISMENVDHQFVYLFKYGDEFNVTAVKHSEGWRAAIKFGEEHDILPTNGIKVGGKLNELSINDWLDWSEKQIQTEGNAFLSSIDDVSMTIDTLTGFNQKLTALNYSINKDGQGWRIKLKSKETGEGSIYWPANFTGPAPLEVSLNKLTLVSSPKEQLEKKPKPSSSSKTTLWPAMDINIGTVTFDNMNLGQLEFHADQQNQTWKIGSALLKSKLLTAEVVKDSSQWQQSSSQDQSKLAVKVTSNNLTALLDGLGYQQAIESEHAQLIFDVSWPGTPLALAKENVTGHLNIDIGKGKLNDVEPGAAGRVFGLMSIAALPRRLALDFSDLFSTGFTFDSIKGDFELANGIALTENLTLNGASAKIEMSGSTDLAKKQYDQQVTITPNVSSTLPLAGAVAGGPVGLGVGAALLVVDKLTGKLFGKNIVNLISYKYHLTGPWDEPQMSVIKPVTP